MNEHHLATSAIEESHLCEFRKFYSQLDDKQDIFYTFFTSNLLHWMLRSLRFVPPEVNLALIGSDLSLKELEWIGSNIDRPFHHIRMPVDDKTVWEFLFKTNENNFGWMDIDCFVLNPDLFRELSVIDPGVVANCTWSFSSRHNVPILYTYFLFLNAEVIRAVSDAVPVSPCTYTYERSHTGRKRPYAFSRTLTPEIVELLRRVIPAEGHDNPEYLSEPDFFDTLQVYQLVANALGYRLHRVRPLELDIADELVHVGKVSYYRSGWGAKDSPQKQLAYALILQSDYLMLNGLCEVLPAQYRLRIKQLSEDLRRLGASTDPEEIREILCTALISRGVSETAFAKIVESF